MKEVSRTAFPVSLTETIHMGKVLFESGLFTDIKSASQAVVKIQAGAELGIPPLASLTGVHIIQGKPTIGAGLMASTVKASGKYNYKVVKQDEKICSIDFYEGKDVIGNSTFTIEDAKKAGTKNLDKFPKNMLFARAMSNGVKWFCPDVFAGPVYTPEDFDKVETVDTVAEVVAPVKKKVSDKGMEALINRLKVEGADIDKIVKDTMDNLDLTDAQAELFTSTVSALQDGGLPV